MKDSDQASAVSNNESLNSDNADKPIAKVRVLKLASIGVSAAIALGG